MLTSPRSIAITGASSGIGAALALAYAAPGCHLALGGRNAERLADVADQCRMRGATAAIHTAEVTDRDGLAGWIAGIAGSALHGRLDLVIANAGISGANGGRLLESTEQTRRIFAVNFDGTLNTVLPAIEVMRQQAPAANGWRGQIAIISSLAGFSGLPSVPAYSASKAAQKIWGEGLRGALAPEKIAVTVVCPGFVRTPMTDSIPYPMPFLMDAERAATLIVRRLARNPARIAFPWPMYVVAWLAGALPPSWSGHLYTGLPKTPARSDP